MKLLSYRHLGRDSYGVLADGGIVDLPMNWPAAPESLLGAINRGLDAMRQIQQVLKQTHLTKIPLAAVKLLPPLPQPPKIIGLAVNYAEHHKEFDRGHDLPDDPKLTTTPRPFLMPNTAIIGPDEDIPWPDFSRQIDYEIELAVVIGSPARRVSPQEAMEHVFGYTIANDISARSTTFALGRKPRPKDDFFDWLHGKWGDGFCPIGPCIVTADEIGDPQDLRLELCVNSEVRQDASTRDMIFSVYELVSFISHIMTLTPGDIIATGTPSGVGMASGNFLNGGDVITCRIDKIGELTNRLSQPPERFYTPCERP